MKLLSMFFLMMGATFDARALPFYGRLRPAGVAVNECYALLVDGNDDGPDLRERLDRVFLRHLVQRYHGDEWIGEDTFIAAGPGANGLDVPRFRVTKISRSLIVSAGSRPKFGWIGAKTDRFREVSTNHPFADDFEPVERATRIYGREEAVAMVARFLIEKSGSREIEASIRAELEMRGHYLMNLDGQFRRRSAH